MAVLEELKIPRTRKGPCRFESGSGHDKSAIFLANSLRPLSLLSTELVDIIRIVTKLVTKLLFISANPNDFFASLFLHLDVFPPAPCSLAQIVRANDVVSIEHAARLVS